MLKHTISVFFLLFWSSFALGQSQYLKAIARPGEGVNSLLRLYQLDKHECNKALFYKLNNLTSKDYLKANHLYQLPVKVYAYNGKSIRTTINNSDWNKAKRIQSYNHAMQALKLQLSPYHESKVLWVPYHELECLKSPSPPSSAIGKPKVVPKAVDGSISLESVLPGKSGGSAGYSIFGKEHAKINPISSKLKGRIYYIVSGHGGPDPGAIGNSSGSTLCEDEYAYDVSLRLAKKLLEHGAMVFVITRDPNDGIRGGEYLPCDRDEVCWKNRKIPINQKQRLTQRSTVINLLHDHYKKKGITKQYAIMIHVDSRNKNERTDLFFYHHPESYAGKVLAKQLQAMFKVQYEKHRKSGDYSGTVTSRDLHMLRETNPTAVYIELGNIQNKFDQKRFILENNRQALANWICLGLLAK